MSKLQLKLQEATVTDEMVEELLTEEPVEEIKEEEEVTEDIMEDIKDDTTDFIDSEELNEIREILLNIPDDISLLLLDDKCVVLGAELDNKPAVYTLPEESEELILIEMPLEINDVLASEAIIKYTEEKADSRHQQIVDILSKDLKAEDKKEIVEEIPTEEEEEEKND